MMIFLGEAGGLINTLGWSPPLVILPSDCLCCVKKPGRGCTYFENYSLDNLGGSHAHLRNYCPDHPCVSNLLLHSSPFSLGGWGAGEYLGPVFVCLLRVDISSFLGFVFVSFLWIWEFPKAQTVWNLCVLVLSNFGVAPFPRRTHLKKSRVEK